MQDCLLKSLEDAELDIKIETSGVGSDPRDSVSAGLVSDGFGGLHELHRSLHALHTSQGLWSLSLPHLLNLIFILILKASGASLFLT